MSRRVVHRSAVVALTMTVAACASIPPSPAHTPYKGDTPWNIARTDGGAAAVRAVDATAGG